MIIIIMYVVHLFIKLGNKYTGTSNRFNLFFGSFAEEFGLDNHWLIGKMSFSKYLVVSLLMENIID